MSCFLVRRKRRQDEDGEYPRQKRPRTRGTTSTVGTDLLGGVDTQTNESYEPQPFFVTSETAAAPQTPIISSNSTGGKSTPERLRAAAISHNSGSTRHDAGVERNSQVLGDQSLQASSTPSMGERSRSEVFPGSNGDLNAPGTLRPRTIVLHEDAGPFDHVAANMEEEHTSVSGSSDCIQ